MFKSLKHWLASIALNNSPETLFTNINDEVVHVALASLLYHVIAADQFESDKEKKLFSKILQTEFGLNSEQVGLLYSYVKPLKSDLRSDLNTLNHYLKNKPGLRMNFMKKLNQLIDIDGINSKELEIFNDAMQVFFPDIKNKQNEF